MGVGAGEEIRTLDNFLGKEALYQLSYARINEVGTLGLVRKRRQEFFTKNLRIPVYCYAHGFIPARQ